LRWTKPLSPRSPGLPRGGGGAGGAGGAAGGFLASGFSGWAVQVWAWLASCEGRFERTPSRRTRSRRTPRFLNRFNNPARRAASPFAFPFRPQKMHTSRGSGVAGRCHAQRAPNGCLAARTGFRLQLDTISGSSASCCRAAYSPFSSAECALFCSRSWSFVDSGFREQNDKGQQLKFNKPLWPCSVCARFLRAVLSLVCIAGTDRLNLTCEFGVAGVLDV